MRAVKVKTSIEVNNRQKIDVAVNNHGVSDLVAWKNPIQRAPYNESPSEGETERSKEENQLHDTGETLLASDAPELVAFIQESDYQSVKDIFIDREVSPLVGLNYKDIPSKYHADVDGDSKEPDKAFRIMSSISNEIEQDFQKYVRRQHALENLMKDSEEDSEGDDHLLDKPIQKMIPEKQHIKEVEIEDTASLNLKESSATELIDDNIHLSEASSKSEAESGSTIHLSDSSLTTMSSLEEFLHGPEYQQPHKTESLSTIQDRMSISLTGQSQSFINQFDYGDCGSFAISPLSGPIPCSGSISLRSTSSTGSSTSFAFPILPSEWNGSPVRMVEADQRQPRKQQSWRTCFLCCKS